MLTPVKHSFPHRQNSDGSHDSICSVCFATVAKVRNESELAEHESAHDCDPVDSYRFNQGSNRKSGD
jgi:hypothetical protein